MRSRLGRAADIAPAVRGLRRIVGQVRRFRPRGPVATGSAAGRRGDPVGVCWRTPGRSLDAVLTTAHTVLPGPRRRSVTPQSSDRAATRRRPRPDSASAFRAGVGDLQVQPRAVRLCGQPDVEVPAGHPPVPYGVGAQLGGDQGQRLVDVAVVGVAPGVQAVRDEEPGEAGAPRGGGEGHGELGGRRGTGGPVPLGGRAVHAVSVAAGSGVPPGATLVRERAVHEAAGRCGGVVSARRRMPVPADALSARFVAAPPPAHA